MKTYKMNQNDDLLNLVLNIWKNAVKKWKNKIYDGAWLLSNRFIINVNESFIYCKFLLNKQNDNQITFFYFFDNNTIELKVFNDAIHWDDLLKNNNYKKKQILNFLCSDLEWDI